MGKRAIPVLEPTITIYTSMPVTYVISTTSLGLISTHLIQLETSLWLRQTLLASCYSFFSLTSPRSLPWHTSRIPWLSNLLIILYFPSMHDLHPLIQPLSSQLCEIYRSSLKKGWKSDLKPSDLENGNAKINRLHLVIAELHLLPWCLMSSA